MDGGQVSSGIPLQRVGLRRGVAKVGHKLGHFRQCWFVSHTASAVLADEAKLRPVLARVDVLGALSLLNSALDAGIRRFVFPSTCVVPASQSKFRSPSI